MTILIDASALVAIVTKEEDARSLAAALDSHDDRLICPVGEWEAARAIARKRTVSILEAKAEIDVVLHGLGIRSTPIGSHEAAVAIDAHARYGRGTGHRAGLNMGDCFAYACARTNDAVLLYKGDDFSHTDLAA